VSSTPLPLSRHIEELRLSLLKSLWVFFCALSFSFYFYQEILSFLLQQAPAPQGFALFSPLEGFLSAMKLSFYLAVLITFPYFLFHAFKYLAPALSEALASLCLKSFLFLFLAFAAGTSLAFFVSIPLANAYFYSFNQTIGSNLWGISGYIDYLFHMVFAHAIIFQLGAALLLAIHYGIIKRDFLQKKRPHALVGSLILGALLTPPDMFTQLFVAIPLYLLYELALMYSRFTWSLRESSRADRARPDTGATHPQGS
jgi:sec-independent protein translocase protein TatC